MARTATNWSMVEEVVAEASENGTVGVALIGPDGARWSHHGDRKFGAASTVKIPIMVEIFRQIDAGKRSLDDRHITADADLTPGSGVLFNMHQGLELTVNDLLYLMISISDNMATNILVRMAGMEAVNRTMRDLGMKNSVLAREMKGRPATASEQENLAAPSDYAEAIRAILDGEAASRASCDAMTGLLEKQQNHNRIARHLPQSGAIRWGSKTGSITGVTNDAGFILAPNGRLIVAVYCENFPDQHVGEEVIGAISRAAMAATGVVGPLYTS
ncbi:MAG: class A beta-lactamase-related serine hydrolase [Thermomicrobia bacterium]|nr:class A beta-lactamase-related serine hydrolase [Thermomicrobia bacterium]MCA1725054.1 class A beta-lactamase-related serine hydrolase [Thermomicrobia bacterium]